jgi:hypothetical protein
MGIEGGLKPRNVWGDEDAGKGNFSPESFADGDESEVDYLIKPGNIDVAANDPTLIDTASRSFTRSAVETDNSVVAKLLGDTELELETDVNLRPSFSADTDPTAPTGSQIRAVGEISNDVRDNNLKRVTLPQGVPMKAGGEIPGDINKAQAVINDADSWQKPAPVREQKQTKTSFLRRLFG